jgi:hypothetical protein
MEQRQKGHLSTLLSTIHPILDATWCFESHYFLTGGPVVIYARTFLTRPKNKNQE